MDTLNLFDSNGNPPEKKCTGPCGRILSATTEFFHKNGKQGLHTRCKECSKFLRDNPPEKPNGYKTCTGSCGRTLPATTEFFHKSKTGKYGLRAWCKECSKAYTDEYRKEHYEEILEQNREYYQEHREEIAEQCKGNEKIKTREKLYREKHCEKYMIYNKAYRQEHREGMAEQRRKYRQEHREELSEKSKVRYQENREEILEYSRKYRQTPRGRMVKRVSQAKRRAQKKGSDGNYTTAQIQAQLKRQKGRCYWRGCKLGKGKGAWHIDHIVPLSRGGTNTIDNIVISCPTCNIHRHNRLPHEVPDLGRLI